MTVTTTLLSPAESVPIGMRVVSICIVYIILYTEKRGEKNMLRTTIIKTVC